jgi:hypothetical protein
MTENEINELRIEDLILFTSEELHEGTNYVIYQIEDIDYDSEPIWIDTLMLYHNNHTPYPNPDGFFVAEDLIPCLSIILPGELDIIIHRHKLVKYVEPKESEENGNISSDFDNLFNQS